MCYNWGAPSFVGNWALLSICIPNTSQICNKVNSFSSQPITSFKLIDKTQEVDPWEISRGIKLKTDVMPVCSYCLFSQNICNCVEECPQQMEAWDQDGGWVLWPNPSCDWFLLKDVHLVFPCNDPAFHCSLLYVTGSDIKTETKWVIVCFSRQHTLYTTSAALLIYP